MAEEIFVVVTLTYQNLLFCRVPIISILGLIIRTYNKVGLGSLRRLSNLLRSNVCMISKVILNEFRQLGQQEVDPDYPNPKP